MPVANGADSPEHRFTPHVSPLRRFGWPRRLLQQPTLCKPPVELRICTRLGPVTPGLGCLSQAALFVAPVAARSTPACVAAVER